MSRYRTAVLAAIVLIMIGASLSWNVSRARKQTQELAWNEAAANFQKDQAFRLWATHHGGVYVPTSPTTPPSPYLKHVAERDITTPSGERLTLMNPAYMLRQIMTDFSDLYGTKSKITSLKPINPANAPDRWESTALKALHQGQSEVTQIADVNNTPHFRLIRPMIIKTQCLKCHGDQGYKEGDIRGGVSVAVPLAPYTAKENASIAMLLTTHIGFAALMLLGVAYGYRRSVKNADERQKRDEEREKIQAQLSHSQKMEAIGQLAGGVAHDFNNLLTSIMGNAELLEMRLPNQTTESHFAQEIVKSSSRAADFTKQLLAFSRKGRINPVNVDIHTIINDVISLLTHSIDRRIEITKDFSASPSIIHGDSAQLQNALLNLGVNARDAMHNGGELIFATRNVVIESASSILHDSPPAGDYVEIAVTDTGIGMNKELQQRVFEPFFTTKASGKGTGLGLASVYGCVMSHQGHICIYSEPGEGSTFRILLPLSTTPNEETSKPPRGKLIKGTGHVLVVDDEEIVRNFAASALRDLGYTVSTCFDGQHGVTEFAKQHEEIDLVLLDLIMPKLSGEEAFRQMKKINENVPVLIASGFSKGKTVSTVLSEGAKGFLNKPYRLDELSQEVSRTIRKRQPAEAVAP